MTSQKNDSEKYAPYKSQLSHAYNLFVEGNNHYKNYSLDLALDNFEKAREIIKKVYPFIVDNQKLKETTDKFLKNLEQLYKTTTFQIKNRYEYKSSAG